MKRGAATERGSVGPRTRPTRRQARGLVTRARILDAVIACVERGGIGAATHPAIAAEAGLSIGAVQHHFPSKEHVLDAVLEESAARFAACFEDADPPGASARARVDDFVDRAWRHYRSAFFRAAQEIMVTRRPGAQGARTGRTEAVQASARVAERVWLRWLEGLGLGSATQRDLRRHAFASMTGLALLARFEPNAARLERPLAHLKTGLVAAVEAALATEGGS